MKMRTTTIALGTLAIAAATSNAAMFAIATSGSTAYRVNIGTGAVESFDLGDNIVSLAGLPSGEIVAFSNSKGPDGFEVYTLTDPTGTPSLSLIENRAKQAPSQTQAGDTLYAVSNGTLFTVNPSTYELSNVGGLGLSGSAKTAGGTGYDAASDTFYYVARDGNLYTIDDYDTASPSASLVGATGVDSFNHGMEFAGGTLYAALQNQAGSTLRVGSIDTTSGTFTSIADIEIDGSAPTALAVVVPTPGAAALIGAAGLAGMRRRR
ncbi:MAG: hypothetical protein AAGD00_05565 [Planctomycetota bacterium]